MTTKAVFIQHSRFGFATFAVSDTHLKATVKEGDRLVEQGVELRTLDPKFEVVHQSAPLAVAVALVATLVLGAVAWKLIANESLEDGLAWILSYVPLIFAFASLSFAIRMACPWELVVFSNHWEQLAVVIVRERNQAAECMAFVDQLAARIELAQSDLDAGSRAAIIEGLSHGAAPVTRTEFGVRKWKLAVVMGALAMALPPVPGIDEYIGPFLLPIVILLSFGTALLAFFSLSSKEPGRWMSLFAIVMAVIPMFIY